MDHGRSSRGRQRRSLSARSSINLRRQKFLPFLIAYFSKWRVNSPLFLCVIIAIPVLSLLLAFAFIIPSTLGTTIGQREKRNHFEENPPSRPDVSTSMDHQFEHPPLPIYTRFAPRKSLFSIVSPRDFLDSNNSSFSELSLSRIHAVLACSTGCCTDTLYPATRALVSQTLPPTDLTFIHSCSDSDTDTNAFRHEARRALADFTNTASSYELRPHALFHSCLHNQLESCVLDYMSHVANAASSQHPHYTLILTDRVLLENTAIEKSWLSFSVRAHVDSIRLQSYNYSSLQEAKKKDDPFEIHPVWPNVNLSVPAPVVPIPLIYATSAYRNFTFDSYSEDSPSFAWRPLIRLAASARLIREPLWTPVDTGTAGPPLLSFGRFATDDLPAHLYSELTFHKWSARQDENEMYTSPASSSANIDLNPIPFWPVLKRGKRQIMLILPWMQMGGSEKCMLDIAAAFIARGWGVTFVLTMPYWAEDPTGELYLRHEWYNRAVDLSADIFDLLALGPDQKTSRLFRYILESRRPEFLLMANSRWAYAHASFIKALMPETVVADYNHMIHMSWEEGGMPRYGANNSAFFDLHLTASHDVTKAMKRWINPQLMQVDSERVQTCYIGTDASLLYSEKERSKARRNMREKLGISQSAVVVLFAGRLVEDKGIDVVAEVVKMAAKDDMLSHHIAFIFVGSGDKKVLLTGLPKRFKDNGSTFVSVQPPAYGLKELRNYYAMSDVFLLPSVNEGIALVVYEAMADGLLVISTDVGGQKEVIRNDTGILLPNYPSIPQMANHSVEKLRWVLSDPGRFSSMRKTGQNLIRSQFTTEAFTECVFNHLSRVVPYAKESARKLTENKDVRVKQLRSHVARGIEIERWHGLWNRNSVHRPIESVVTIGVKTFVCDDSVRDQVHNLVRSIRVHHPNVRILLGNDGPTILAKELFIRDDPYTEEIRLPSDSGISYGRNAMVNLTTTKYFLLLDDDHVFDDTTKLETIVSAIQTDNFNIVGLRVRNLPGIEEYERIGILIPRYVAIIQKFEGKDLTLCVWNENNGPSVYGITHPIPVDVLHNAFLASTDILRAHPWRNELKVNEHMTFFLDAKYANLSVGYLPSVFVHHRARDYSNCYYHVRFREDKFEGLLDYRDQFLWDIECGDAFPNRVKKHILVNELDSI